MGLESIGFTRFEGLRFGSCVQMSKKLIRLQEAIKNFPASAHSPYRRFLAPKGKTGIVFTIQNLKQHLDLDYPVS